MQPSDSSGDLGGGESNASNCSKERRSTLSGRCAVSSFWIHMWREWNHVPLFEWVPAPTIIGIAFGSRSVCRPARTFLVQPTSNRQSSFGLGRNRYKPYESALE